MGLQYKIKIVSEELHKESIWCKQILSGLTKELKKKRMGYSSLHDTKSINEGDYVFVVGAGHVWLQRVVEKCNQLNITPIILSNLDRITICGRCHLIYSDIANTMRNLRAACLINGREKIALYGIQNFSGIHEGQRESLLELVRDTGDIYMNNSGLDSCFHAFLPYADRYDTVVCMSGYAAVSLVKKLETMDTKLLKNLTIISCEEILLSSRYKNIISFVDMKLDTFGSTAISIMELLEGKENNMTLCVSVEGAVQTISSSKTEQRTYLEETEEYLLFADPEEVCLARVEKLLESTDEVDQVIIELLLNGATYSQIADDCYMTEGNVKYRVKKYLNICKVNSKKELLDMLGEYLPY